MRGHGSSDKVRDITSLLSDPHQAPFDFDGALRWLERQPGIDSLRVGAVGTSIGGAVACEANAIYGERLKAAVAISPSLRGTLDFLGHEPGDHRMHSVLYIAADGDGTHAHDAEELASKHTDAPKDVILYHDVSYHGIDLFEKESEIRHLAVEWLEDNLR